LGEKRVYGKLTIGESSGGGVIDGGERNRVKACKPGSMPKNVGDIVSLPRERGMAGLGRR